MTVNQATSIRIKNLLKEKKISLYRLAMNSGVSYSTLKNIVHDTITDNKLSTIILIEGFPNC